MEPIHLKLYNYVQSMYTITGTHVHVAAVTGYHNYYRENNSIFTWEPRRGPPPPPHMRSMLAYQSYVQLGNKNVATEEPPW